MDISKNNEINKLDCQKIRKSNFEIMRIVSMLFIVLWHIILHGHMIDNCTSTAISEYLKIIQFIIVVHVNSFVLLSGYFQSKSKFKLSKLLSLILQVIMYISVIYLVAIKLGILRDYNRVSILQKFLPSVVGEYWFISTYIIVYIFSDYINKFISKLQKSEFKHLLLVVLLVFSIIPYITGGRILKNDGYNFYNFILLYLIGAYLRKYPLKESYHFRNLSINGYRIFLMIAFFMSAMFNYLLSRYAFDVSQYDSLFSDFSSRITASYLGYSNLFVIIQTICFFEFFRYINIKSRVINYISSCTFGVYLFHDNRIVRGAIYRIFGIDHGTFASYKMILYMFVVMFMIFFIGVVLEMIRKLIIKLMLKLKFIEKMCCKLKNFCLSFNFDINW